MLSQYVALEFGLDDRAVHDAVLGDFDADQAGSAADHSRPTDFRTEFVRDAVGELDL